MISLVCSFQELSDFNSSLLSLKEIIKKHRLENKQSSNKNDQVSRYLKAIKDKLLEIGKQANEDDGVVNSIVKTLSFIYTSFNLYDLE